MQTTAPQLPADPDAEYRAIEAALVQTARGRWFLAEHGRRARRLDSAALEDAIGRLQTSLRQPPAVLGQLKAEIEALKGYLTGTRAELASRPAAASGTPATPGAQQGILVAAEDIHELAWSLQAKAPDPESCEQIARHAARLYAMSLQQAVESARLAKFSAALDEACGKLSGILETIGFETAETGGGDPPKPVSAILPPPPTAPAVKPQ